jgi:DNA uptake protein ComE-like DNA-binding protein
VHVGRLGSLVLVLLLASCGLFHRRESIQFEGPIDLNTASLRDIEQLPGITPSMAERIVAGRPYADIDELVDRKILSHRELERIKKKVTVGRADQKKGGDQPADGGGR